MRDLDVEHLDPGAIALEHGLCPGTFKVRLCNNFWMLKAVVFRSFQLH